jgi:hypothetical protein
MASSCSSNPIPATIVRFRAYVLIAEFECHPSSGVTKEKLIHNRYESYNPFSARRRAIRDLRRIKTLLDKDLPNSNIGYNYEGASFYLEYEVSPKCSETAPEIKQHFLLDGIVGSKDELIQRFSSEEFLLDLMDYSFVCVDVDESEELEYAELADLMFDGVVELNKTFV